MKRCHPALCGAVVLFSSCLWAQDAPTGTWKASGKRGAVCAGGQEAVDAGLTILKSGGNAADAAVATILALSVTDSSARCGVLKPRKEWNNPDCSG